MKFKPKRVIGYGCSFTAGEETIDHIVAGITDEEMDSIKINHGNVNINSKYNDLLNAAKKKWFFKNQILDKKVHQHNELKLWTNYLYSLSNEHSYVRYLADQYSVSWKNRAIAGGSNEQILYRLVNDIYDNLLVEGDLVICGLTSFSRIFWLEKEYDGLIRERTYVHNYKNPEGNEEYKQIFDMHYNPYYVTWTIYQKIKLLTTIGEELEQKGIKLVIIPVLFDKERDIRDLIIADEKTEPPRAVDWDPKTFLEEIFNSKYYKNIINFSDWIAPESTHGWGHPKATQHERFAKEYLYNILEDDTWFDRIYKIKNKEELLKEKLEELRKRDPFIYR